MNNDWDTVTKIGSRTRGPGAGPRETVIKGKSALNAAQRSGAVISTEKKYGSANASSSGGEGQRLTKVDRNNDITPQNLVTSELGQVIARARSQIKNDKGGAMTQKEFAAKLALPQTMVADYERGTATKNNGHLKKMERVLGVQLTGDKSKWGKEIEKPGKKK
ncbi:multi protein-like protein-bridging factor 1 [Lojkania enalia]|uniref:Multiprotein-bridging factor 1 n=1 Tax=Lojkania enalia TaxID=147567 RepID=A0A9P4K6C1_9PLEO|nr:multi protein-like protein-bridging factor 1 [Didymosphaeria enalia]